MLNFIFDDNIDVTELIRKFYNRDIVAVKHYRGWLDETFIVTDQHGDVYSLKLVKQMRDSELLQKLGSHRVENRERFFEAEIDLIQYLTNCGVNVPKLHPTVDGLKYGKTGAYLFRLQSFLEGRPLEHSFNAENSRSYGRLAGQLSYHLSTFQHEVFEATAEPNYMLSNCYFNLREISKAIAGNASLLEAFFVEYDAKVASKLDQLPSQVVHCDFNDRNVLLDADEPERLGVIDFSDARKTYRLMDVAIAISCILYSDSETKLQCIKAFLEGYQQSVKLNGAEREALPVLIAARFIMIRAVSDIVGGQTKTKNEVGLFEPELDIVDELMVKKRGCYYEFFEQFASQDDLK